MHETTQLVDSAIQTPAVLDSDFLHVILHNELPSAIQARQIPGLVQEREKQVRDLRLHIDRLRALEVKEKQAALELHALRCASASPVRRLPSELLVEVFACCQSNDDSYMSSMTVSHVCYRWRAVAFGAARLWTRLTVTRTYARTYDLHLPQIVAWFARASPLPVDIHINSKVAREYGTPAPAYPLFATSSAPQLSAQVRKLVLHPMCHQDVEEALYIPGASFPQLTHLEVHEPDVNLGEAVIVISLFGDACHCPKLRTVVLGDLTGLTSQAMPRGFPLPWYQLEILSIDGFVAYDAVCTVFLSCSRLLKAQLSGEDFGDNVVGLDLSKYAGTVFSSLEDLDLELSMFPSNITNLAHYPALTKFRLSSADSDWSCEDHHAELLALVGHMPMLTDLTLVAFNLSRSTHEEVGSGEDSITSILAHLPTLHTLRLEYCYVHISLFTRLRVQASQPVILPHLETLELSATQFVGTIPEGTACGVEELYGAVKSRATSAGQVERMRRLRVGLPFGNIERRKGEPYASLSEKLRSLGPEVRVRIYK